MEDNKIEITEASEQSPTAQEFEIVDAGVTLENALELHRYIFRSNIRGGFLWGSLLLAVGVISSLVHSSAAWPMLVGAVAMFIFSFALMQGAKKNAQQGYERSRGKSEIFQVYSDHLEYRVICGVTVEMSLRIPVDEISDVAVLKTIYAFKYQKVTFGVLKENVAEGSALFRILFPDGVVKSAPNKRETLKTAYTALYFAMVLYMAIVISVVSLYPSLWPLPMLGLLLSVSTFVVCGIARRKGIKISGSLFRNIILAFLSVLCLLYSGIMFASKSLDMPDTYTASSISTTTLSALSACDLQLPSMDDVYVNEYKTFDEYAGRYVEVANTEIYLSEEEVDAFCDVVEKEDRWVTKLDGEARQFFRTYVDYYAGDVFFVYNLTEGTYNTLPSGEGECDYLVVIFSAPYNYIDVYEFTK